MKAAPPGWEPHNIMTRIDGWLIDPQNETRIPAVVAELMARAMPQPMPVDAIRVRMIARQRMAEKMGWLSNE